MSQPRGNAGEGRTELRGTPEERAYDEYLEAALRGEAEDLDAFCARHGDASGELRRWIEALLGMLPDRKGAPTTPRLEAEAGLPFERIGEFRLIRRLGAGGMGVVFLAEQEGLGRLVALKVIRPEHVGSADAEIRFKREAQAVAKLRHPNIVTVFATGEERGVRYLAMELVPGKGFDEVLAEVSARGERIPIPKALRWIAEIARALQCAHEAGVVHRDVKPSNLRVTPQGKALLVDFGLAREVGSATLTLTGEFRGTAVYASPEQVAAKRMGLDARTDVYSLGVTLYECVTGSVPYEGETTEQVFHQILSKDPVAPRRLNPSIPRDLETVVLTAMEKDRDRRYATAGAFADDLEALLEVRPIRARPSGPVTRAVKFVRRNPGPAAAAGLLLLAAASAGALAIRRRIEFRTHVSAGWQALAAGELPRARAEAEEARGIDRVSGAARDLLEAVTLREKRAAAEEALAEARVLLGRYRDSRRSLEPIRRRVEAARRAYEGGYTPRAEREAQFADLDSLERGRREMEEAFLALLDALNRAARQETANPSVSEAFAEVYLEKWKEAEAAGDEAAQGAFRAKVLEHDRGGGYAEELEGKGTVAIKGLPEGAEVYAFRYELLSKVKSGGERRLVPVPFHPDRGILSGSTPEFAPGDVVLAVEKVDRGSPADRAGLRGGDLVLEVAGSPIEGAMLATEIDPDGPAAQAGVRAFDRLARLAGRELRDSYDADQAYGTVKEGDAYEAVFVGGGEEKRVEARKGGGTWRDLGCRFPFAEQALSIPLPPEWVTIRILSGGEPRDARLEGDSAAGLRVATTASPLVFAAGNLVGRFPLPPFAAPPGSYLFVLRKEGYEDLRIPSFLERRGKAEIRGEMLPEAKTPPGFLWVAPGPFVSGGDPEALFSLEERAVEVAGFWIARFELTAEEYLEFLNDPETLKEVEEAQQRGEWIRVPRGADAPQGYWPKREGKYEVPWSWGWPVLGVSWKDAQAYCRWRTERGKRAGEPWVYGLPTEHEREKAARGVDGRRFPWGDFFDWSFCKGARSRPEASKPEPVGRFVRGESPWGVMDMSGSVTEWCDGWFTEGTTRPMGGGGWGHASLNSYRAAGRYYDGPDFTNPNIGFRLVAREARRD